MNPLSRTLSLLASAFERAGISFAIGGSIASGARGILRSTYDIDLIAAIRPEQTEALARELGADWYADPLQMKEAIAGGGAFNVIQMKLGFKVDVFPATEDFHFRQLERASLLPLALLGDGSEYPVASAEDILLAKLRWYRQGGEVSERQWADVAGILTAGRPLDAAYLEHWAQRLGVTDLLEKAQAEASGR